MDAFERGVARALPARGYTRTVWQSTTPWWVELLRQAGGARHRGQHHHVMYSTDNGAETFTWPDGGTTPFRGEKNTTWEGGFRVPMMVKWPGNIEPGQVSNEIISMEDWMPTLLAAAGVPDIKEETARRPPGQWQEIQGAPRRLRLFAVLQRSRWRDGPRKEMFYFTDDGQLSALRYGQWKIMFYGTARPRYWRSGRSRM